MSRQEGQDNGAPTISVITPSFNQGRFLPLNLRSVARQTCPPLEHLVFDPGSEDDSRAIAAAFSGVTLIAEPDEGQADAVAKGMLAARGDIIAWLNADDEYYDEQVFAAVLQRFSQSDQPDIVYGRAVYVDESGTYIKDAHVNGDASSLSEKLKKQVGIVQPAAFIHKRVVERIGPVSRSYGFCMDYDYWIQAIKQGVKFAFLDRTLASARYYPSNKTLGQRGQSLSEVCAMVRRRFGFVHPFWFRTLAEFNVEGFDGVLRSGHTESIARPRELETEETRLAGAYNGGYDTQQLLKGARPGTPEKETLDRLRALHLSLDSPATLLPSDASIVNGHYSRHVGERKWKFNRSWTDRQFRRWEEQLAKLQSERNSDICVVVGNGPSLALVNSDLLRDRDLFISNFAIRDPELISNAKFVTVVNYLVAEQGAHEFNLIENTTKIVPSFLSYCVNVDEHTFFAPSLGNLAFSKDASRNVSWRSTVTFFNLQLAYSFGYKKVILIGFDHSYKQQAGVKEGDILVCTERDENHFRPDYFQGLRWQAADVNNMESVYLLAKEAFDQAGREIVNCTIGGNLEIFRRGDLQVEIRDSDETRKRKSASPEARTIKQQPEGNLAKKNVAEKYPRLLMIDSTPVGSLSATGMLKQALLGDWPADRFLQIWENRSSSHSLHAHQLSESPADGTQRQLDERQLLDLCQQFDPAVIYFRPIEYPLLMEFAEKAVNALSKPLVIHMMDDWPERMREENPELFVAMDGALRRLLAKSTCRLSVCEAMSKEYRRRYGYDFFAMANAVDLRDYAGKQWAQRVIRAQTPFTIRYMGALADDMTYSSVSDIAHVISDLQDSLPVRLEIYTMEWCRAKVDAKLGRLPGVSIYPTVRGEEAYRNLLQSADALVIAYNFDPASIRYVRLSMANKMPECLASGVPVLAYGPPEVATMEYLAASGCAVTVDRRDKNALRAAILSLAGNLEFCRKVGAKAREFVGAHHSKTAVQNAFLTVHRAAATEAVRRAKPIVGPFARERKACLDETRVIAHLATQTNRQGTMIDVGAHHGGALLPFLDKNWKVFAFEPDSENYSKLQRGLAAHPNQANVLVDCRAVGNAPACEVPFYRSEESAGISTLNAFRPSHNLVGSVDVTTLTEFLAEKPIARVDVLKIDTEGHDYFVLQGFPWHHPSKPAVIECEFEDAKTIPLGYTFHDLAKYLREQGYQVYVSEWHPVGRYGIRHDWHRLTKYPSELADKQAWGNLLAFREAVDEAALVSAVKQELKFYGDTATKLITPAKTTSPSAIASVSKPVRADAPAARSVAPVPPRSAPPPTKPPFYAPFGEWLRGRSPRLFRLARFVRRALAGLWRRRVWTAPSLLILAALPFLALHPALAGHEALVLGGAALAYLAFAVFYLAWRVYQVVTILSAKTAALHQTLAGQESSAARERKETAALRAELVRIRAALVADAKTAHDSLAGEIAAVRAVAEAKVDGTTLRTRLAATMAETDALRTDLATLQSELRLSQAKGEQKLQERFEAGLEEARAVDAALEAELRKAAEKAEARSEEIRAELEVGNARTIDRIGPAVKSAVNAEISAVRDALDKEKRFSSYANAIALRVHERRLTDEDIQHIEKNWLRLLGLSVPMRQLHYIAHQICLAEERCEGRIATTIQAAMLRTLALMSLQEKDLEVLEIGTLFGIAAGALYRAGLRAQRHVRLTLIDPLEGYYDQSLVDSPTGVPVTRQTLVGNMSALGVPEAHYRIVQHRSTDAKALEVASDRCYDYVLIDGDHSLEGVASDFQLYGPYVKPGGVLIFDDYDTTDWPAIKPFVDEHVRPSNDWLWIGSDWRTVILRRSRTTGTSSDVGK